MQRSIEKSQVAMVDNKNRLKIGRKKVETVWCEWHNGWGKKSESISPSVWIIPMCRHCRGF